MSLIDKRTDKRMFPPLDEGISEHTSEVVDPNRSAESTGITRKKAFHGSRDNLESVPLKKSSDYRPRKCCGSENGLRAIVISIVVFSVAITVALVVQIYYGEPVIQHYGIVVSDSKVCSAAGGEMLRQGGSAVDAAVATTLCLGVVHPHATGLGGGGFMLIHLHTADMKTVALDFRESVPSSVSSLANSNNSALTVGVPGQLHGLYTAHKLYGKLPWQDVVKPAIDVAKNGFNVSLYLNEALRSIAQSLHGNNMGSRSVLAVFESINNTFPNVDELIKRPALARTLEQIASAGASALYEHEVGEQLVRELLNLNAALQMDDLRNYSTIVQHPLEIHWKDYVIQSAPAPSSGPVLLMTLNLLKNFSFSSSDSYDTLRSVIQAMTKVERMIVNITEITNDTSFDVSWKNLTDDFLNINESARREDRGSSVVASDMQEQFVTVVSGLGSWFGSGIVTSQGIVLNDALKDLPAQTDSMVGKRPISSYAPVIAYRVPGVCNIRLASGGASSTLVMQTLLNKLALNMTTEKAIETPRFDVEFSENIIFQETDYNLPPDSKRTALFSELGLKESSVSPPFISINMICKDGDAASFHADNRGRGAGVEI